MTKVFLSARCRWRRFPASVRYVLPLFLADRYDARYLVLDDTRPRTTDALYAAQIPHPPLKLRLASGPGGWQLYEIAR